MKSINYNGIVLLEYPLSKIREKYIIPSGKKGCRFCYFAGTNGYGCNKPGHAIIKSCRSLLSSIIFINKDGFKKYIRNTNNPYE